MKDFFSDIFEYHCYYNQELIVQYEEHQDQVCNSLIALLSHVFNTHQIWNARILKKKELEVHELRSFEELKEINLQNYKKTLFVIETYPLQLQIDYTNSKGIKYIKSIQEILFHIANHSTHHKGQLIAGLRKQGITPITTDYIFYKR